MASGTLSPKAVPEPLREAVPRNSDMCSREFALAQTYKEEAAAEFTGAFFLVKRILFKMLSNPLDSELLKAILRI